MLFNVKRFYTLGVNFVIMLMLTGLCILVSFEPTTQVSINTQSKVYYSGNTNNNNVTLMINVYWGNEYIEGILDEFESRNIKTTFFVGGMWVSKYSELLQRIAKGGHEIGNHGYFHKEHSKLNYQQNQEEILNTHKVVKEYLGYDMTLFAPPSGEYNDITIEVASNLGYKTIMWSRDTIDWRDKNADLIYKRAVRNLKNGDLILMHPTLCTLQALPKILDYAINNGFCLTTVSENIES